MSTNTEHRPAEHGRKPGSHLGSARPARTRGARPCTARTSCPSAIATLAFADTELPLGHGESHDEAGGRRPRAASAGARSRTSACSKSAPGSGFLTACMAQLADAVLSVEQHADLAEAARARLAAPARRNVRIEVADALDDFATNDAVRRGRTDWRGFCVAGSFPRLGPPGGRLFADHRRVPGHAGACCTRASMRSTGTMKACSKPIFPI